MTRDQILECLHVLLGYAESRIADGDKRPLYHMALARAYFDESDKSYHANRNCYGESRERLPIIACRVDPVINCCGQTWCQAHYLRHKTRVDAAGNFHFNLGPGENV